MFAEYCLSNAAGMRIVVSELGAAWVSCVVPLPDGNGREVLLAGSDIETTLRHGGSYAGAIVGRYAGRIANARYRHHGEEVTVTANQPPHCLHGGALGFSRRRWEITATDDELICHLDSLAWAEGFPGNMRVEVRYHLSPHNEVTITYHARSDADTACNLTNHAYFNLNGGDGDDGLQQHLQIFAAQFLPVAEDGIPVGDARPVAGTGFDFRAGKMLAADFLADDEQQRVAGYDHSFLFAPPAGKLRPAAVLQSADERVTMNVATTQPALHLYTGQFLAGLAKRDGGVYANCAGVALETQAPPDSPNRDPEWGILPAGEAYQQQTKFSFVTR